MGVKISELSEIDSVASGDEALVLDISDTTQASSGSTKRSTFTKIKDFIFGYITGIYATLTGAEVLTNKTLTSPVVNTGISGTAIDTDTALTANSDTKIASQKATKTYSDTKIASTYLDTDTTLAANSDSKIATQKATKAYVDATGGGSILTTAHYAPEGFLINGKIVPSVASNNLTLALKGMDGNDPSATNPVYCRIGSVVRSITAALSITTNAGNNWLNLGSTELAAKETDLFVYLGWNTNGGGNIMLGISRVPYINNVSEINASGYNERGMSITGTTSWATTDILVNVGRFAATLSAGAGYTWSVPTFTAINLIQRPIYETRWLIWVPTLTWTAGLAPASIAYSVYRYKIREKEINISVGFIYNTGGTTVTKLVVTSPMSIATGMDYTFFAGTMSNAFAPVATMMELTPGDNTYPIWVSSSTVDRGGFIITHEI